MPVLRLAEEFLDLLATALREAIALAALAHPHPRVRQAAPAIHRDVRLDLVIEEMLDHIGYVEARTKDKPIDAFWADRDIRQSVERSLEIISEASRGLPDELKERRPEIPWRQVADFGNVLRHAYFALSKNAVWHIITEDLPMLRNPLDALLRELPE